MLSKKAKYALKAMFALAEVEGEGLLQIGDIAQAESIPKKFLDLILLDLRHNGLVQSHRGKQGGYELAKPADQITAGMIVRVIDGPIAPIPCASVNFYRKCDDCDDERTCRVRRMMRDVRDAASAILDNMTLAEAIGRDRKKKKRLLKV